MDRSRLGCRPDESPLLQPLVKQAQTLAIPPQQLEPIPTTASKHKDLAGKRVFFQHMLNHRRHAIKAFAHVGMTGAKPNTQFVR